MKKVFTVGVYDLLHIGHINLFRKARELGDELTVAVQTDECVLKYKPDTKIVNNTNDRLFMVSAIRYVDHVIAYSDVDEIVKQTDFDVFAKGADQCHIGFQRAVEWCKAHGKEVVVIPRTEGISSTMLRKFPENP